MAGVAMPLGSLPSIREENEEGDVNMIDESLPENERHTKTMIRTDGDANKP